MLLFHAGRLVLLYFTELCFLCFLYFYNSSVFSPTGAIVLLSLAFLMPAFYYIPKASLAAVIICAVAPMVDFQIVAKMWKIRSECLLFFHHLQCMFLRLED